MDTNRLKKFASEARAILKRGVAAKMLSLGFDRNGHIDESEMPVLIQGGSIFRGQQHTEAFYHQWMSLHKRIEEKGIKDAEVIQVSVSRLGSGNTFDQEPAPWIVSGRRSEE